MEMEKTFYVVTFKPTYVDVLRKKLIHSEIRSEELDNAAVQRVIVAITQGGFGQDVVDDEQQVKERFLEYLFSSSDIDLARDVEVFDEYFGLEQVDEFVDLDEEY